jgi:hypothetical protein
VKTTEQSAKIVLFEQYRQIKEEDEMSEVSKAVELKIMSNIDVQPGTECWIWKGGKDKRVRVNGQRMHVRRAAYLIEVGDLRDGVDPTSACGNDDCINPEHAEVRTPETQAAVETQATEYDEVAQPTEKQTVVVTDEQGNKSEVPVTQADVDSAKQQIDAATAAATKTKRPAAAKTPKVKKEKTPKVKKEKTPRAKKEKKAYKKLSKAEFEKLSIHERAGYSRWSNANKRGSSLTPENVREIRAMKSKGKPSKEIAAHFHIATSTVADIVAGRLHKKVE